MKAILLGMILQSSLFISAQEAIIAKGRQQNTFYAGIDNPIEVFVEGVNCSSIFVTTNNGKIERDGCHYNYQAGHLGSCNVTIYKKQNGKLMKLKTYEWYVIPVPKPVAHVGAFSNGSNVSKGALAAQPGVAAAIGGGLG